MRLRTMYLRISSQIQSVGAGGAEHHSSSGDEKALGANAEARSQAERLVEELCPSTPEKTEVMIAGSDSGSKLQELLQDAARIEPPWRERAGIDAAIQAIEAGEMPRPRLRYRQVGLPQGFLDGPVEADRARDEEPAAEGGA